MKILNLKKKYPFNCLCGHKEESVGPSMFMSCFQQNVGGVHCPGCKEHIFVKINDTNDELVPQSRVIDTPSIKPSSEQLPEACYRDATKEEEETILERQKKDDNLR